MKNVMVRFKERVRAIVGDRAPTVECPRPVAEIMNYASGKKFAPPFIMILPVYRCNMRCSYCIKTDPLAKFVEGDREATALLLRAMFGLDEGLIEEFLNILAKHGGEDAYLSSPECTAVSPEVAGKLREASGIDYPTLWNTADRLISSAGENEIYCLLATISREIKSFLSDPPRPGVEAYRKAIEEAARMGVQTVQIAGFGEPFLEEERVLKLMEIIKGLGMRGEVVTNATVLSPGAAAKMAELNYDSVIISIDVPREAPELAKDLKTVTSPFRRVMDLLKETAEEHHWRPEMTFWAVLTRHISPLEDFVDLAAEYGVATIHIMKPMLYNNDMKEHLMDQNEYAEFLKELSATAEYAARRGVSIDVEGTDRIHAPTPLVGSPHTVRKEVVDQPKIWDSWCYEPWVSMMVGFDGSVYACCRQGFSRASMGNIKTDSLADIYYNSQEKVRARLLKRDIPEECGTCPPWNQITQEWYRNELKRCMEGHS